MSYPTLTNSTPPFEEPAPSTSLGADTTSSKPYKHVPATVVPVPPLGSYTGLRKTPKRIKKTDEVTTTVVSPSAAVGATTDPCSSARNEKRFFEDFSSIPLVLYPSSFVLFFFYCFCMFADIDIVTATL